MRSGAPQRCLGRSGGLSGSDALSRSHILPPPTYTLLWHVCVTRVCTLAHRHGWSSEPGEL